jgi:hypothetical protein
MEALANIILPTTASIDERIAILAKIDLNLIDDPESVLYHFVDITSLPNRQDIANRIAEACKAGSGTTIVTNAFYFKGRYSTIMDALIENDSVYGYPLLRSLLTYAFAKAGFKRAQDCDPRALGLIYKSNGARLFQ